MKKLYCCLILFIYWLGWPTSLQAQTPINLGKTTDLIATFRAKASINSRKVTALNNQIKQAVPGQRTLFLNINTSKKEGSAEVFIGNVVARKNSSYFLKADGTNLSGYLILQDEKRAYQYSSKTNGQAYLQEVDINKVICVDLPLVSSPPGIANNQVLAPAVKVPLLESLPGAGAVVLLDFDGEYVSGTGWNGGKAIDAAPAQFSSLEMEEVWKIISEDFRPYELNITTNEAVFAQAAVTRRMRVIFTPTRQWYGYVGGVAYIGSFNWNSDTPCWAFNSGVKAAGDVGSHEVGHTLKLRHDGRSSPAETYYYGQGNWAPIMGSSYYREQAQWSKGEYPAANNKEDDVSIMATNGFKYRSDDHSNTTDSATVLTKDAEGKVLPAYNKGIITTDTDTDVFSFITDGGKVSLQVNPNPSYPNLDVLLTLKNDSLKTIAKSDSTGMSAALNVTLAAGTYYLYIDGATGDMGATSNYGSLGEYSIAGFIPTFCIPALANDCKSGDIINNFSFHNLVNYNSDCGGQAAGYTDYLPTGTFTTTVSRGQTYKLSVQAGASRAQGFGVWIDYNNDQDFGDAGEFIYSSPTFGTQVYDATITIPLETTTGTKRLRVRSQYQATLTSNQECAAFAGETEDYIITIQDPVVSSTQWNLRYGGKDQEGFTTILKTADGGYLSGGFSTSGMSGDKTQDNRGKNDYWIIKTDANGQKIWDKRYGGAADDYLNRVIQTIDGGYLLAGSSLSGTGGDKTQNSRGDRDYWIVKINSTGVKQWDKRFGGSGYEELKKVLQLSTGEYILAGYSNSPASGDKRKPSRGGTDYWIVKVSSTGSLLWERNYGGDLNDILSGIVQTADGGFVLGGSSVSGKGGDKTEVSRGDKDFWLVRIDKNGKKLWDKTYGGSGQDDAFSLGTIRQGGFFIAGQSDSPAGGDKTRVSQGGKDFWFIKVANNGVKIWDKRFGGSKDEELRASIQTSDGGFILAGKSFSDKGGNKTQNSQGSSDYWIVKTDQDGMYQWDKRFGGSGAEELRAVTQTSDGGLLLAGKSESGASGDKTQPSQGKTDFWLVKVAPDAKSIVAKREANEAEELLVSATQLQISAHPNPFSDKVTISFTLPDTQSATIKVYDLQGREITTLFQEEAEAKKEYTVEWKVNKQKAGIYILQLLTPTKHSQHKLLLSQ
ncbi:T9SS type A sorting domain-containing protein (plasmid) [Adhaeribacter swui]|uniref:T9SS type A sorting domain-containing protein n=1 Tax=Adhaeribacter swui TaxID=2086471 RepID=A0A7G7G2J3_9BACT|nr:GEVED domain-containing protein [Adhaeribacter swui]QNF31377.1 T9SS type A sorting domain-containing protein [Adhaeribacter swui]